MSQQPTVTEQPAATPWYYRGGRNVLVATATGVVLLGAVVATLAWWNWGFILLVAAALSAGVVEVHNALARIGARSEQPIIIGGTLATVLGSYLVGQHPGSGLPANTLVLGLLALTTVLCLVKRLGGGPQNYIQDAAASLFSIGYLPLLGSTVALMMAGDRGVGRIVTFILCVIASDIGGFVAGVAFGKHPMAPHISPKKTWEGFSGSLLFGMATGVGCAHWLLDRPWWVGIVLGVLLVAFGAAGDLVESMVKRDVGIKDMSHFLPGHGGVMDRLDSLLVAAPVAWFAMFLMVPGG